MSFLSKRITYSGKSFMLKVLSANTSLFSDYDDIGETDQEAACEVDCQEIVSLFYEKIKAKEELLDLGGIGDCFLLCVNEGFIRRNWRNIYSIDEVYKHLGIPINTYIEDSHIGKISALYKVTIYVTVSKGQKFQINKFGDYERFICIHNEYPAHYLLYKNLWEDHAEYLGAGPEVRGLTIETVQEEGKYETTMDDYVPDNNDISWEPKDNYREIVDASYLYQYVESRYQIVKQSKQLGPADSKIYYKLRHNYFKTTLLDLLNLPSLEEEPFSKYGVDSRKTPDFLAKYDFGWLLIEFTVVKKFQTSIKTKLSKSKYTQECSELSELSGLKVFQFYPTLGLDEINAGVANDVHEIQRLLEIETHTEPESVFNNMIGELNTLEFDIAELIPDLLLNSEDCPALEIEPKFKLPDSKFNKIFMKAGAKKMRNQHVMSLIRKNISRLDRSLKYSPYKAKFKIFVNMKSNNIFTDIDKDGLPRNALQSMLQNLSSNCLDYVVFLGKDHVEEEPFQIYGMPKVVGECSHRSITETDFATDEFEQYYYNKLMKTMKDPNKPKTLVDNPLDSQVGKVRDNYLTLLDEKRKMPNVLIANKNHFIFPFASCADKGTFSQIKFKSKYPITNTLFNKARHVKMFEKTVQRTDDVSKMDVIIKQQNACYNKLVVLLDGDVKLCRILKQANRKDKWESIINKHNKEMNSDILKELEGFHEKKKELSSEISEPTRTSYQNRIQISQGVYKRDWKVEMEHFSSQKGKIKISEDQDLHSLEKQFLQIIAKLWSIRSDETQDDIYSDTIPIGDNLKDMLTEMRLEVKDVEEEIRSSQVMFDLELISRVCYTLMFFSNIKLNKDDFMYDNLGYKDVIIFVKGGKKILGTKTSRLFKLCFPVDSEFMYCYSSPYTEKFVFEGKHYVVLPWQTFRFPMLKKGLELYYSFSNYFISSYIESGLSLDDYKMFITSKVLNMYSQRRKVEIWFGYFRYLYLNSLSTHTSVLELINDMADFDYDPYMYYCQRVFADQYSKIVENAKDLKVYDIFTKRTFSNFDLCSEKFDESLFMAQAPFDRTNEHLKNLRSVLELHSQVTQNYSMDPLTLLKETSVDIHEDDYFSKMFSDDLKFDPGLSQAVGVYAGKYLSRIVSKSDMSQEFSKIINDSSTKISTSKGMRSTIGEFWGKKGHDVVYNNIKSVNRVKSFFNKVPKTNSEFRKELDMNHESFREMIESLSRIDLEFDIKDKAQWKGSREIYVMSDNTKLVQQPLERFFKYLCRWVPNELIHKASHVRPKYIHSQVYEFSSTEEEKMLCTLDCRKWAPKSNLWKYYFFILGMSPYLPIEFVEYFMSIWSLMFYKKVRIQARFVEMLEKNAKTVDLVGLLTKREDGDYEFVMPYSFMMGIFNYLSSLLHSFSQLYFNDKIASRQKATLNLIAHSDDSGGVILSKSYEKNLMIYCQYELYQKSLNHLMSKKKCALSKTFFEMISIMYANKRLIPMTHKFLSNVSFEPKGKGWVDDISCVVSKVVEIFSNGGTMRQCYLTMLSMGELTRKAYHIPRFNNLSKIPLAFGGLFNMHPIHLILLGADAQEIMLDTIETSGQRNFRIKTYINLAGDYYPGKGTTVKYKIPYYKRHSMADTFTESETETMKLISSCLPGTTLGDTMAHFSRIRDSSYVYSLEGVDMCQIFVMTLFTKTMIMREDEKKVCDMRRFCKYYSIMNALKLYSSDCNYPLSMYHHYMKAAESMKLKLSDINVESQKTCKPITYSTFQNVGLGLSFKTINEIIAYNSDADLGYLFPDKRKMDTLTKWVRSTIKPDKNYDVNDYLMKLSSKDLEKVRSSYCFIPSGLSLDTIERFWTYSIFYCTKRYHISAMKPQYFTIDQFRLWSQDYETLKHYYLIMKIILKAETVDEEMENKLKTNMKTYGRSHSDSGCNMIDEMLKLKRTPNYTPTETSLPFVVYHEAQKRSVNVWYGSAEFTLHTMFGNVRQYKRDGEVYYHFNIVSEEFLDQIYFLLKNFLTTRGILSPSIEYSVNDSAEYKLGFTDLNQPCTISPGSRAMLVRNSAIVSSHLPTNYVVRDGDKFTFEGNNVDLEVYQNYDINPSFYKLFGLSSLKEYLMEPKLKMSTEKVIHNLLSTKLYKVVASDDSHAAMGTMEEKYCNSGLLGSERSFSRGLALADMRGETNYMSSVNPKKTSTTVLEGLSFKDIPVLDLLEICNFSRVTFREKKILNKIADQITLQEKDKHVLDGLIGKLGVKPTMTAITLFKVVVSNLSYEDVPQIGKMLINEFLEALVISALKCISDRPKKKSPYQSKGTINEISTTLYFLCTENLDIKAMSSFMIGLFIRAHYDNPALFWDLRKKNIYAALYQPDEKNIGSQCLFMLACIKRMDATVRERILNTRQVLVAKNSQKKAFNNLAAKLKKQRRFKPEYLKVRLNTEDMEESNYFLPEDDMEEDDYEDALDAVSGGDDPENFVERTWDEDLDEKDFYIITGKDRASVAEMTLTEDFSEVRIYSLFDVPTFPWLGRADIELEKKNGILFNVSIYPGKGNKPPSVWDVKPKTFKKIEGKALPFVENDTDSSPKVELKRSIFETGTDEEIHRHQVAALKSIGVTNPEHYKKYFYDRGIKKEGSSYLEDLIRSIDSQMIEKANRFTGMTVRRTSEIPGFTTNLKDEVLSSELNAIFSLGNTTYSDTLAAGNQKISVSSYKMIVRNYKLLYAKSDETSQALIIIALSTMRDAITVGDSDGWYVDSLINIVNIVHDRMMIDDVEGNITIPKPLDAKMSYETTYAYDDYFD